MHKEIVMNSAQQENVYFTSQQLLGSPIQSLLRVSLWQPLSFMKTGHPIRVIREGKGGGGGAYSRHACIC